MKVKDLISTLKQESDHLLYYDIDKEGSTVEYVFTSLDIDEAKSDVPFIFERDVLEWHYTERDCPFNHSDLDSDTLYITTKE